MLTILILGREIVMPVISLVNSKGGVGKSTTALILAQVYSKHGYKTALIDADPNQPLMMWEARDPKKVPSNLTIIGGINEQNCVDVIDDASEKFQFVIVDVEGSANMTASITIGRSDFVLIPTRGSQLDADQSSRVIQLINQQSKAYKRDIPYSILFTCTSVLQGRDFKHIRSSMDEGNIPVLDCEMVERAAFRAVMQFGGTIYDLSPKEVSNPKAAITNAEAVAQKVAQLIQQNEEVDA